MSLFWMTPDGEKKSYEELMDFLSRPGKLPYVLRQPNGRELISSLLAHFVRGNSSVLLDHGMQESEVASLGLQPDDLARDIESGDIEFENFDHAWNKLENSPDARVYIYTSGTTGRPKKVGHSWKTLARAVRRSSDHKEDVWALAYHAAHFAGLQVMLQAIGNQNPIIDLFHATSAQSRELMKTQGITHISATPAFYRRLLLDIETPVESVRQVTCGGEKYDAALVPLLEEAFPNAAIRNVYASTEAGSLFSARNDVFKPGERVKDLVRVSPEGELWIHHSLLGDFSNVDFADGWYRTGDMVEQNPDGSFRFVSRKQDFVNVGGYKVNPLEVEDLVREVPGVVDCVVRARSNSVLGNILEAFVQPSPKSITNDLEKDILTFLRSELQPYKVPRVIRFVDRLESSHTGKRKRR